MRVASRPLCVFAGRLTRPAHPHVTSVAGLGAGSLPKHPLYPPPSRRCASAPASEEESAAREALGNRAYREVQIARRRRREADDESVLFRCAEEAGFFLDGESADGDDDHRRRRTISRFLTARAEEMFDAVVREQSPKSSAGFSLKVAPSQKLPQPIAGDGVFIESADGHGGEVPAGTLLVFYPGSVYLPHEVRWLGGQGPALERAGQVTHSHVIGRVDGVLIDGLWSSLEVPAGEFELDSQGLAEAASARLLKEGASENAAAVQAANADVAAFCKGLADPRRGVSAAVPAPSHAGNPPRVRHQNPFAVGEMINHPPHGEPANVLGWPVDLDLFGADREARALCAPSAFALRPEGAVGPGAPCPHTVVLVAATPLRPGDELFLDYGCELLDVEDIPVWFTPAALRGEALERDIAAAPHLAIRDELRAWRQTFEARYKRRPSRHDLMADPSAAALFETFQKYRKLGDL